MSEVELKRRKLHGVLSSKSLLESLDNLILNKKQIEKSRFLSKPNAKVSKISSAPSLTPNPAIDFTVVSKNSSRAFKNWPRRCQTRPKHCSIQHKIQR